MSLIPMSSSDFFDWGHPSRCLHKWFDPFEQYLHPFKRTSHRGDGGAIINQTKEKFQATIDVKHFTPSEIQVKIVDNQIVVEGKHEEKEDPHGYVTRHFLRKYPIPEGHDSRDVFSNLSIDGFLTVISPKTEIQTEEGRIVPIVMTGPLQQRSQVGKPEEEKKTEVDTTDQESKEEEQ